MRYKIEQHPRIVGMILLALFTVCFLQLITAAKPLGAPDPSIIIVQSTPIGLARGQSLRLTGLNPDEPGSQAPDGRRYKMLVAVLILDGTVVAQSDEFTIEPGTFRSFDFDRDDLHLAGEPGTGRVQLSAQVRYRFFSLVDRTQLPPASLEILDIETGITTAATSHKPKEIVVVGSRLNDPHVFTRDLRSTGMVHGQTLRFSLLNPNDPSQASGREPVRAQVRLFDANGRQLAQSSVVAIPAGEFRSFDFNRDDLPLAGEPGTGRLQLRGKIILWVRDGSARSGFCTSVELIKTSTGETTVIESTLTLIAD
jgi:hypothetical protein